MQLVNDAPVANSQPVAIASLKLADVVVPGIGVGGNFLDFPHNPLLPVHRKPGKRFREGFCGDDRVHLFIVTLSNNYRQAGNETPGCARLDSRGRLSLRSLRSTPDLPAIVK